MDDKYKMMVYICSPYKGDIDVNVEKARKYCRWATDRNCIAIAPHLLFPQFMSSMFRKKEKSAVDRKTTKIIAYRASLSTKIRALSTCNK